MNGALFRLALRRLLLRRRSRPARARAACSRRSWRSSRPPGGTADAKSFASLMEQLFLPTDPAVPGARDRLERARRGARRRHDPVPRLDAAAAARDRAARDRRGGADDDRALPAGPRDRDRALARRRPRVSTAAWALASVVAGACAYAAAFGALSLRVKRPVVIGLIYVLFWEGSIATFAPSARWLSLGAYARAVVAGGLPVVHRRQRAGDRRAAAAARARRRGGGGDLVVRPPPHARRVALAGARGYRRGRDLSSARQIDGLTRSR